MKSASLKRHRKIRIVSYVAIVYGLLAYLLLPELWTRYEITRSPVGTVFLTKTAQGIPGDPVNIGLSAPKEDLIQAMHGAGWSPADAITLRSSIGIIDSVVFHRPDPDAPVSNLYYDGRPEDLAFEKLDGVSADRRQHVRFWNIYQRAGEARAVWLGSATFDEGVGLSHYTGAVTHHIAPNVDAERDQLAGDLVQGGMVEKVYRLAGLGPGRGETARGIATSPTAWPLSCGCRPIQRGLRHNPPMFQRRCPQR